MGTSPNCCCTDWLDERRLGGQPKLITRAGHSRAAALTARSCSAGGRGLVSSTRPSSSWSNTAGADSTHWPAPTHESRSTETSMPITSPSHRQSDAGLDTHVVLVLALYG